MYTNEYLYFKSLKDFRSAKKDDVGRLDPRELNIKNLQLSNLVLRLKDGKEISMHEMEQFNAQYMEHLSEPKINSCSMHWIDIETGEPPSTFN